MITTVQIVEPGSMEVQDKRSSIEISLTDLLFNRPAGVSAVELIQIQEEPILIAQMASCPSALYLARTLDLPAILLNPVLRPNWLDDLAMKRYEQALSREAGRVISIIPKGVRFEKGIKVKMEVLALNSTSDEAFNHGIHYALGKLSLPFPDRDH